LLKAAFFDQPGQHHASYLHNWVWHHLVGESDLSKSNKNLIGVGIVLGAAVGVAYVATRAREFAKGSPRLIDWNRVTDIAMSMNREDGDQRNWKLEAGDRYMQMVQQVEPLVSAYTGSSLPSALDSVHVFDRRDWIKTNVANFEVLFEPIERIQLKQMKTGTVGAALMGATNQLVLSGELGVLIGYLAKRVLGQYDFSILGKEALSNGRLYFVEPNIATIQEELGLSPADFRLWIALHETTHAYQFEAHPWLREYFNNILSKYFEHVDEDLKRLTKGPDALKTLAGRVVETLGEKGRWVEIVMTKEQRDSFRHMQALMCVIEGYSNHVMNAVGCQLLPSYDVIRDRVENRQTQKSTAEKIFIRLTGLDIKFEQYRLGEKFVEHIVKAKGMPFMNKVWEGPENIPTLEEIDHPDLWIKRVATPELAANIQ
jgi:coenzyme F420 biosynthesis associated uncharacterized protein